MNRSNAELTEREVLEIKTLKGISRKVLAKQFGVHPSDIDNIKV